METSLRFVLGLMILGTLIHVAEQCQSKGVGLESLFLSRADQEWLERLPTPPEVEVIARRSESRREVLNRLRCSELSLLEAAVAFKHLNDTPSDYPNRGWTSLPGKSDGEKLCRQVILSLIGHLGDIAPASELEALQHCLLQELEEHLATHGTVILPEQPRHP